MNTSATGGFLQPEPGLARSDIERLIGDVIAGITGLPRDRRASGRSGNRGHVVLVRHHEAFRIQIAGAALRNRGRAGHEPRAHP